MLQKKRGMCEIATCGKLVASQERYQIPVFCQKKEIEYVSMKASWSLGRKLNTTVQWVWD